MSHFLTALILRNPKLALWVGIFFSFVFGVMGVSSFIEMQKLDDKAPSVTLENTAESLNSRDRYWVNIQDGEFDCESIYYQQVGESENTEIFLKNHNKSIVMLVTFSDKLTCQKIKNFPTQGVAYKMSEKHKIILVEAGRLKNFSDASEFLELCSVCSKDNSKGLTILSALLTLASLSLYPLVLLGKSLQERKLNSSDTVEDVFKY